MNRKLFLTVLAGIILVGSVSVLYLSARSVVPKPPFLTPPGQEQGGQVKFETLGKAQTSEHQEERNYVVNNVEQWRELWDKITGPSGRVPVDFQGETVLAVFQGQRGSAGYVIEITKIVKVDNSLEVFVTETSPGSSCLTAQVITAPYHIVKIEKFTGEVRFNQEQKVTDCQ